MSEIIITEKSIAAFGKYLSGQQRSPLTISKYAHDIAGYSQWLSGRPVSQDSAIEWRNYLLENGISPVTVNAKLASVNAFFRYAGISGKIKYLRLQRRIFRNSQRELTKEEYDILLSTAKRTGQVRLFLLMETICSTGIRVSEVKYITVESVKNGFAEISLKGKIRTILLPGKLCRKLIKYAKAQKITSGEIFITRGGKSLSRNQIWSEMKRLCSASGVAPTKVFPHNLRHLFARIFYKVSRDIAKLSDVLGHSSIETTRIYLISTGEEHARQLDMLGLIS